MLTFKHPVRVVEGALLLCAALSFGAGTSLLSQQAPAPAAVAAPAPATVTAPAATPAPASSSLFARTDDRAPTLAAAKQANDAAIMEGSHTVTMTTTVLVLVVILLVLLIA